MPEETLPRPKERRGGKKPRLTIGQILDNMQFTADEEYSGDLQNNALAIFNTLSVDDKRTYLRKSLESLWEKQLMFANEGLQEIVVPVPLSSPTAGPAAPSSPEKEVRISPVEVKNERESLETGSYVEQQKLRQWLVKIAFAMMVLLFFAVFFFSAVYGKNDMKTIFDAMGNLNTLIDLLLKPDK
jgi:hypothetical protein